MRDHLSKGKRIIKLFTSMLYISAFTFGGGFVIVTFMRRRFVEELGWLTEEEMLDMTALAQTSPGAIAVNAAILVGWHIAGIGGMIAAVLGTVIPPMVTLSVVSVAYEAFAHNPWVAMALAGMQAGVAAVIADVVFSMAGGVVREKSRLQMAVMLGAFAAAYIGGVNVAWIIAAAALAGAADYWHACRKERKA